MLSYTVRPGDTLLRIARDFGISAASLLACNPRLTEGEPIPTGIVLQVPPASDVWYTVQEGDTLHRLSELFGVEASAVEAANRSCPPALWAPGTLLRIPVGPPNRIVDARAEYGPGELSRDCARLAERYRTAVEVRSIGESVMGKPIIAIRLGSGPRVMHANGAVHANEWITSMLLMTFAEDVVRASELNIQLRGVDIHSLLSKVTLWIVPMVNPDGVQLVQEGLHKDHPHYAKLLEMNRGSGRFSRWKANVRGVDLNDQFPAHWEEECSRRGTSGPGPRDYPGAKPLSEPEAAALAAFTEDQQFELVLALHTQGQEIYWNYRGFEPPESERIAFRLGQASGYRPVHLTGSDAGYKDWFIQTYRKPGFTIEAGIGVNPLPLEQFDDMYDDVVKLLLEAMLS
ncbi:peptidase M14 carboxypeptidase A [Paenibacillus curdlanolyticus YK9]|uniref:Peptidase M14 carboxypeptidase A n=1 Tax=Paenibacillus curdlanolyticus YK9 TaxID=717606 RepID=E0I4U6_9BACL|nr:M14 family metallopeptidase [Paenibacillus curdlanolyticus]EFM12627.1 peptidase M14 carboxypeptidase A [Paenibacillus curdlanolyticus YK9]